MPVAEPGAAVSPGTRICSLVKPPGFTAIAGLVFGVFVLSVISLAVTVQFPAAFNVTLSVFVPLTSAVFPGRVA